ncbi:hypothetical protein G6F58_013287 [Rhizopus delemar]|nr:hypothetical protein G6F58_013287 [Rhizopus delemar]
MVGARRAGAAPAARVSGAGVSGCASISAWMLTAADWPSMPRCKTERRSRRGRKISVPAISTISSASTLMSPAATRQAPSVSASAAPSATPRSLMPRVSRLTDSTQKVLSDRLRARAASRWPQA